MAENPFRQIEEKYFRLKGQLATARITREQFDAALKELVFKDADGRYWMLGADSAKWYIHDGQKWVEASPPGGTASGKPKTLPEQRAPAAAPTLPARVAPPLSASRKRNNLPLVFIGAVLVIGLVVVLALSSNRAATNVALPATNTLVANQAATPAPPATSPAGVVSQTPTAALASSNVSGVHVSVVAKVTPAPIAAKDFAMLNASLAEKIAAMNQAQLKFIRDLRASSLYERPAGLAFPPSQKGSALTDEDLKDLAGKAMDVAVLSDQLGELSAKQDKGSGKAAQSAEPYFDIARNALSLVVDAQNVRQGLLDNILPGAQAIQVIAEYGLQLWNSEVTDGNAKGNPFAAQTNSGGEPSQILNPSAAAQVQSQVNAGLGAIWIAKSASQTTKTLDVPAPKSPGADPFDSQVLRSLTTANGQNDGNQAQQVAAATLQALGAKSTTADPAKPTQLQVPTHPVAIADGDQIGAGNLPTFKSGKATIVAKDKPDDENAFMQTVGLNGEDKPTDEGKTTVADAPTLVNLSLTNIVIGNVNHRPKGSGTFEADVNFSFTVNWSTTLASPQFTLSCNSSNNNTITQTSGSLNLTANGLLILYPGTLSVYCYANSTNGQSLGSTSVNVLIGDADKATERANQVETDSAALDATLTAEASGTQSAQQTQTASALQTQNASASQTAQAQQTIDALSTEVAKTETAEFKLTATAFAKQHAEPAETPTATVTPTFTPKVVDQLTHPGDVFSVSTRVVLERGRLYRFTFSGQVNLINPTRSVSASQLPDHVNGVAVPASGIVVIEGTGGVATITCGSGEPDPNDPGGYGIVVEDLGPL